MHFRHHHRRHCLLHLVMSFLGIKAIGRCHDADPAKREELKSRGRLFHSKLKDAFAVWEETEQKEGDEATAEQQG